MCANVRTSLYAVQQCEASHTVVKPPMFWMIPFVAWFMIPYTLLCKKNAVIRFGFEDTNNMWTVLVATVKQGWMLLGPFILFFLYLLIMIKA